MAAKKLHRVFSILRFEKSGYVSRSKSETTLNFCPKTMYTENQHLSIKMNDKYNGKWETFYRFIANFVVIGVAQELVVLL